jgi:hypothetical protein
MKAPKSAMLILGRWIWENSRIGLLARRVSRGLWLELPEIADGEDVFRAIPPVHIKPDGSLKPAAFQDKTGLSVNLCSFTSAAKTLEKRSGFALVRVNTGAIRGLKKPDGKDLDKHDVVHDPDRESRNYAHALVVPVGRPATDRKMTTEAARALMAKCQSVTA